jgi:hypothetical protein
MIIGGGPNLRPHVSGIDIPKTMSRIPLQRRSLENLPHIKPSFDYEGFFSVMGLIELDQSMFDELPHYEEQRTLPGSERVNALLNYNQTLIKDIIKRIGGIPLKITSEAGENISGRVTELHDFTAGKWEASFQSPATEVTPKIYHTTQELRAGYLATIISFDNEENQVPSITPEQAV